MNILQNITFLNPEYFWLSLLIPVILFFFYKKDKAGIELSSFSSAKKVWKSSSIKFYLKFIVLSLVLLNFIVILANPNKINVDEKIKKNWIDIVVALDISGSMEAEDLKPNRLAVAKNVISDFVWKLQTDRLGLVVFAWKPFTSIPLTFDYNVVKETLERLSTDTINQQKRWLNWTAIWDAILMAKTLFKSGQTHRSAPTGDNVGVNLSVHPNREKVIILLTDWDANVWVNPVLAWLSAKKEWIKIYTIWIWSKQGWYITYDMWPFKQRQRIPPLNDKDLKQIATDTWWMYFRAENNNEFKQIFKYLQKLEKNDIEVKIKKTYSEYYKNFVYSLIILMSLFIYLIIGRVEVKK